MKKFDFKKLKRLGIILIVSGPSGAGKSTICKRVMNEDSNLVFSISCTTRKPRPGEVDGVDYKFITVERFEELIKQDEFIEYANVHGNYYGTLKSEVFSRIRQGLDVLLDIDVQGALNIKNSQQCDELLKKCAEYIFIAPPDSDELEKRLRGRGTEKEDVIAIRLKNSLWEVSKFNEYDYLIVNNEVDIAVEELKAVVKTLRIKTERFNYA